MGGRVRLLAVLTCHVWLGCGEPADAPLLVGYEGPPAEAAGHTASDQLAVDHLVWIVLDTLRSDRLGCYGAERVQSPYIDDLARRGVRFTSARSETSWTVPAVASMFTGMHPRAHGVTMISPVLDDHAATLAEILRQRGFTTAGFSSASNLQVAGLDRGFDAWDEASRDQVMRADAETVQRALDWLDRAGTGPTFLFVHLFVVHAPHVPPAPFDRLYPPTDPTTFDEVYRDLPLGLTEEEEREKERRTQVFCDAFGEDEEARVLAVYDAQVSYADMLVGRLLTGVSRMKPHPLVVLNADHGELLGESGCYIGHGIGLSEAERRVPLILQAPGLAPRAVDAPIQHADLLPTLLTLMGEGAAPEGLQGCDQSGVVVGRLDGLRTHTFGELHRNEKIQQWSVEEAGYRAEYRDLSWAEPVFDVHALHEGPPRSTTPLVEDVHEPIRAHLRADMEAWWTQTPVHVHQDADFDAARERLRALGYID